LNDRVELLGKNRFREIPEILFYENSCEKWISKVVEGYNVAC
jgi:hypothetical protein